MVGNRNHHIAEILKRRGQQNNEKNAEKEKKEIIWKAMAVVNWTGYIQEPQGRIAAIRIPSNCADENNSALRTLNEWAIQHGREKVFHYNIDVRESWQKGDRSQYYWIKADDYFSYCVEGEAPIESRFEGLRGKPVTERDWRLR